MKFGGKTFEPLLDEERLNEQLIRIYRLMNDSAWRTLQEISTVTSDPEASVSARLRDLRKPEIGGFFVERRRVASVGGLWEYRLLPADPGPSKARVKLKRNGFLEGLKYAARALLEAENIDQARSKLRTELLRAAKRAS